MTDRKTILVVEDDDDARITLCEVLADAGYECVEAIDGRDAIRRLSTTDGKPSVILLDLMMPGMNGWEFRDWQRQDAEYATIPVVILSAATNAESEAKKLAVSDFIPKPINLDALLKTLRRYCPAA
jgi:CheY-like chemotaxis protein